MKRTADGTAGRFGCTLWGALLLVILSACESDPPPNLSLSFPLPEAPATDLYLERAVDAKVWDPGIAATEQQRLGLLFLGGVDGGYLQPGDSLYSRLGARYSRYGVLSIFVKYREAGALEDCVADALTAARWLGERGITRILVFGWSFGGAVGIHAVPQMSTAVGFVGLSPQSLFTDPVAAFRPSQSLFLIHSRDDENIPSWASEQILEEAPATLRKKFIPLVGFDHALHRAGETLDSLLFPWTDTELGFQIRSNLGGGWMPAPLLTN